MKATNKFKTCVDLFAGGGGFSTGARMAGFNVKWAANHWPLAVEYHTLNHPSTKHSCQDLQQAKFALETPDHDILLASPACQGHSRARGKERAHHDACRSTAWAVISAVEAKEPKLVIVENVTEFQTKWKLYEQWEQSLVKLGYHVTSRVVNSADLGVPQDRRRLFITASRLAPVNFILPSRKHSTARDIIDFYSGRWSQVEKTTGRRRSLKTLEQVYNGRKRYGKRFLVAYYGSEKHGRSLDKPLGTVGTRDTFAVIDGDWMRMLSAEEYRRAMGFPEGYILPAKHEDAVKMLGNAVVPQVAAEVIKGSVECLQKLKLRRAA